MGAVYSIYTSEALSALGQILMCNGGVSSLQAMTLLCIRGLELKSESSLLSHGERIFASLPRGLTKLSGKREGKQVGSNSCLHAAELLGQVQLLMSSNIAPNHCRIHPSLPFSI